jgi:leader peptidase (prepilin peptidase)/N-methyltransferase
MGFWLVLVLGLCFGSFLNAVIYRLPRGISVGRGRSFCPKCKHKISWHDNIPLLSFLILGGGCRYCRSSISWRYPLVEMITGGLFVLTFNQIGLIGQIGLIRLILSLTLISGLIAIFFIDLEHQIIPDKIIFPLTIIYFFYLLATNYLLLASNFLPTAIISFLFFLMLFLLTRGRGMGFGDVKFAFFIGLTLGFPKAVLAFYLAFLTGALVGIILILLRKAKFGQRIAFGPFLALATLIAFLWGEEIIKLVYP